MTTRDRVVVTGMRLAAIAAPFLLVCACSKSPDKSGSGPGAAQPAPAPGAAQPAPAPAPAAKPAAALDVGSVAPDFALQGSDGKVHRLADDRGKRAVVLAWFPKAFTGG